ncbi:MAG: hypothetical protein RRY95_08080 [Oscillospiraceae bacterium]
MTDDGGDCDDDRGRTDDDGDGDDDRGRTDCDDDGDAGKEDRGRRRR